MFWGKNSKKKKESKARTTLHVNSRAKDTLKALFELPIQEEWLDSETIDKINRDSTVSAAIGSRKAATLKKEIVVTCKDEKIKSSIENIFNYELVDSILDTPYQGFSVFEINWSEREYIWYPKLVERDYKEFVLDSGELKFNATGVNESIPPYKAVHATYKAKPNKTYGQPIYNPLFWLIEFKNGSMEFWIDLLERFGTPWVIAKTDDNKNELADEIYNMLGGDGAVLGIDDSLEIKTADKSGDFKGIIEYLDNQIREVILGGNLTAQVKGGSQAAATVHNEIRIDLARADENILNNFLKTTLQYFKEVNHYEHELLIELKDKEDPNIELSTRDKTIFEMGYKPTKEYIQKTYNIDVEDVEVEKNATAYANKLYSFSSKLPQDELEAQTSNIDTTTPLAFQIQMLKVVEESSSYKELQEKLLELYPNTNTSDLEQMIYKYVASSHILAHAEVEEENPNG
ncbi:MAG: DUF935 family protein [Helicobacteraceae bacterium]|nr:DUF935 family protein [Helicobacteraceae bacterium]